MLSCRMRQEGWGMYGYFILILTCHFFHTFMATYPNRNKEQCYKTDRGGMGYLRSLAGHRQEKREIWCYL